MTDIRKVGTRVVAINDERVPAQCRGRVFVVRKVNPKNLRCDAEDGGRGINFPAELLLPATDENVAAQKSSAFGVPYTPYVHFALGEIVSLDRPSGHWTVNTPLVVTGGRDKVNVAPIGGDDDRYLRAPRSMLIKRDMEWLKQVLGVS